MENRICGKPSIDIGLLERHTTYGTGISRNDAHVRHFWTVLHEFSTEERQRFLRFAWGQSRLPPTEDFRDGKVRMLIKAARERKSAAEVDQSFPRADTCFFNVELARYSSLEVMRRQLSKAISFDWGLDGDDVDVNG